MVDCVNPFDQRRGGYSAAPFTGSASQLWPHLLRTSSVADLRPTTVHHLCKAPLFWILPALILIVCRRAVLISENLPMVVRIGAVEAELSWQDLATMVGLKPPDKARQCPGKRREANGS